jgi:hypothetical protein
MSKNNTEHPQSSIKNSIIASNRQAAGSICDPDYLRNLEATLKADLENWRDNHPHRLSSLIVHRDAKESV